MLVSVKPKKKLGQHFLLDKNLAKKITEQLQNPSDELIIEIGCGTGVLTQFLIEKNADFLAFDVDESTIKYMKKAYPLHSQRFVLQDYLQYPHTQKVVILGNLPYNISSQIFFKIWDNHNYVQEVVCMVQKEVAQRICASPGVKIYGILSVLLGAYYDIAYLFSVPPEVFNPRPKVFSAVIRLRRNETVALPCDQFLFKTIVKAAFGKRRKTLRNALKGLNLNFSDDSEILMDKRAEHLSVEQFIQLTSNAKT